MKSAAQIFYLAFFSAVRVSDCADSNSRASTRAVGIEGCVKSTTAIISDACISFSTLDNINLELKDLITDITLNTDFFSYYRLNLFGKECPFWSDDSSVCGNIACAVNTLDNEEQIPIPWRAEELGKLQGPRVTHPIKKMQQNHKLRNPSDDQHESDFQESCVIEDDTSDDQDYCISEDESIGYKGDYVSLVDNPERFTGYAGEGPKQIWDAIYRENCFSGSSYLGSKTSTTLTSPQRSAASELKLVLQNQRSLKILERFQDKNSDFISRDTPGFVYESECLERRVFYRIVSGMHTSISAHICYDYLDQKSGRWSPNIRCYKERIHNQHDRISNLYFNYAIVMRAIIKLGPYLSEYAYCSDDATQNSITKIKVQSLVEKASAMPQLFDESVMFVNEDGPSLKEDFRRRFRNISRIMDCVGCDKCRLWGKLQTAGYGAALKVLFESGINPKDLPKLRRTEIVALFNTFARISSSMEAIKELRFLFTESERENISKSNFLISDRAKKPRRVIHQESWTDKNQPSNLKKEEISRRKPPKNLTLYENICSEIKLFWKVAKYVIRSWLNFPVKL
ncbi:Endoplasmic reticulum oxidoreductin-1 [Golovinomyces cichoracearum]|uniref:Endoplasmic reticulum oxidoreductin-1 n=1 Tax=Golovinomyces cichoracearum TaxID=62708 RepID=A0A420IDX9_9PEZI|nr:Endoplasmic reticulum oxidoreductin-1 [Golovinomyces cichoracearum]